MRRESTTKHDFLFLYLTFLFSKAYIPLHLFPKHHHAYSKLDHVSCPVHVSCFMFHTWSDDRFVLAISCLPEDNNRIWAGTQRRVNFRGMVIMFVCFFWHSISGGIKIIWLPRCLLLKGFSSVQICVNLWATKTLWERSHSSSQIPTDPCCHNAYCF